MRFDLSQKCYKSTAGHLIKVLVESGSLTYGPGLEFDLISSDPTELVDEFIVLYPEKRRGNEFEIKKTGVTATSDQRLEQDCLTKSEHLYVLGSAKS